MKSKINLVFGSSGLVGQSIKSIFEVKIILFSQVKVRKNL